MQLQGAKQAPSPGQGALVPKEGGKPLRVERAQGPGAGPLTKSPGGGLSALMTARQKPHSMSGILSPVGVLLCCCHPLVPPTPTPGKPPSLAARGGRRQAAGLGPQPTDQWLRLRKVTPTHTPSRRVPVLEDLSDDNPFPIRLEGQMS